MPPVVAEVPLYAAHEKVYPREITGRFARLRTLAVWVLLGIFYLLPWLQWNGRQAVLFDLPARKFFIGGLVFWPQDFIFLTGLLIIAALSLFFFTALAGRLWCGYACPQTVWTETFLWMERFTEGDRNARLKLDRAPWSAGKILRKGSKQVLWVSFALWTGFTFVGFFTPVRTLAGEIATLSTGPWETFWVLFYAFATYGNAGYLREQVCKYMCPYARFQSAMFDRDTLVITYDAPRGEPRGARRKGTDARAAGLGDCVDCTWCVQVCPTGIDIRKGLQLDCIACAACIDACDAVMDRVGSPRGLIRYATQHAIDHEKTHILRPRVLIYGGILASLVVGWIGAVSLRSPVALDVIRDRRALYQLTDDDRVDNVYTLRILNKTEHARRFRIAAHGASALTLLPDAEYDVPSGAVFSVPLRVRRAAYDPVGAETIVLSAVATDDPAIHTETKARFLAPAK